MTASENARRLLAVAARAADAKAGEDLVAIDVSEPLPFADVFLLVSGSAERNVVAIADAVVEAVREEGQEVLRREGRDGGRWALLDFGDLVVHVFHTEERMYYGLERLWRDCPAIPVAPLVERDGSSATGSAGLPSDR
ncbi:ribosome silencing factor [Agromyces marinus]|uniref:Ribosomal silencing factor RsfS n=1 Tax=Agromyces marinus TaxID=1389020 RepID=A0ABM8GX16_9MICO|nr:ribosome silencing factor [Agromyces marinus]UIP58664.1 Ribosomal silencing factor RsfS [Agromyces marinus]BDZ53041.1 ribosomal silencing factor RsfS [Agromyces marinus]